MMGSQIQEKSKEINHKKWARRQKVKVKGVKPQGLQNGMFRKCKYATLLTTRKRET